MECSLPKHAERMMQMFKDLNVLTNSTTNTISSMQALSSCPNDGPSSARNKLDLQHQLFVGSGTATNAKLCQNHKQSTSREQKAVQCNILKYSKDEQTNQICRVSDIHQSLAAKRDLRLCLMSARGGAARRRHPPGTLQSNGFDTFKLETLQHVTRAAKSYDMLNTGFVRGMNNSIAQMLLR